MEKKCKMKRHTQREGTREGEELIS